MPLKISPLPEPGKTVAPLLISPSPRVAPSPITNAANVRDAEGVDGEVHEFLED